MSQSTAVRSVSFFGDDERPALAVPSTAFDLDGFRAWVHSDAFPEKGRASYLAGEVTVFMSPEEIQTHTKVKACVYSGWGDFLRDEDVGEFLTDGVLLINEEADLGTSADGLLCLWESLRSGKVSYCEVVEGSERYVEVRGAPDIAAEIVSRSSVHKDTVELVDLYYRAGVDEYWLIDARRRDVSFRILVRGASAYVDSPADADGFVPSGVLGKSFRLTRTTDPVGGWRYRLEFR